MVGEYETYLRGGASLGRSKSEAKSLPLEEKVAALNIDVTQTPEGQTQVA